MQEILQHVYGWYGCTSCTSFTCIYMFIGTQTFSPCPHPVHTHLTDISSLLQQLGLEHYQERFEEEELDFDTFLTMSESDLKEIGVNTLGARRKIQIAISGEYISPLTIIIVTTSIVPISHIIFRSYTFS